jgi:sec-independent protein translocase protein TatA
MMFGLGTTELIVIGVIVFFIFGAKRIPEIGKGLGGALREFRSVKKELSHQEEDQNQQADRIKQKNSEPVLEENPAEDLVEKIPGVKKAMELKKEVEKAKKILG